MSRGDRFLAARDVRAARGRALVGNAAYHTVGDREAAARMLVLAFDQSYADIGRQCGAIAPFGEATAAINKAHPERLVWWRAAAAPLFDAFTKWKAQQLTGDTTGPGGSWIAYGERWSTDWDVYEDWHRKLLGLRAGARTLGLHLTSPEPGDLPRTIAESAEDLARRLGHGALEKAGEGWTLAKVAIYGGLGVLGAVALGSLASNLRSGKDPAAPYLALARRR